MDREKLYDIATRNIHQKKRRAVISSHLKHIPQFGGFQTRDFEKFVVDKFLEKYMSGRKFSPIYIKSVVESIQRKMKISVFNPNQVFKIAKNLNKVYNPENRDKTFYTDIGVPITLEKYKPDFNASETRDSLYSCEEICILKTYYNNQLNNFLSSTKSRPDEFDELALLMVFLFTVPRRVGEVLSLTIKKINDLIIRNETDVKSKQGSYVIQLIVPSSLSMILERYINKNQDYQPCDSLFKFSYKVHYSNARKNYRNIFNKEPVSMIFHGLRNYFAEQNIKDNPLETSNVLGHSVNMSRRYANRQCLQNKNKKTKNFINGL